MGSVVFQVRSMVKRRINSEPNTLSRIILTGEPRLSLQESQKDIREIEVIPVSAVRAGARPVLTERAFCSRGIDTITPPPPCVSDTCKL